MRNLKAIALGLFLSLASTTAFAQCGTTAPANKFCGNDTGSSALAGWKSVPAGALTAIGGGTVLGNPTAASAVPIATIAPVLGIPGSSQGQIGLAGATSGTAVLRAQSAAGSAISLLPTAAGTLVGTASSPLAISATTGLITCATCVTSSGGGAITGTSPIVVSAAGVVSFDFTVANTFLAQQTIAPSSPSNNSALVVSQTTPSTGSVAGPISLNLITVTDNAQSVTGGSPIDQWGQITNQTSVFRVNTKVTGGSANHFGMNSAMQVTATNGGTVAQLGSVYANSPGNTITGDLWANIAVGVVGPTTNLNQSLIGYSAEMLVADTGVVRDRVGFEANSQGPTTGTTVDAAFMINTFNLGVTNFLTAAPWKTGLYLSKDFYGANTFPIATTGDVIKSDTGTVTSFVNAPTLTVSGNILDFPNLKISGTGGAIFGDASVASPSSGVRVRSSSAAALLVGANTGTSNQAFTVDASNGSGNGVYVYSTAAGSGANITVVSSGTNEALKINAKGSGTIDLGGTSTGGVTVHGSFTATGLVTNADLVNAATTVNGQTCTLGAACTVTAVASGMVVGTTAITSGTSFGMLYSNSGVLGNTVAGTTTTVLHGNAAGAPTFGAVANADLATMTTNTVKGNATSGTATPTDLSVGTCSTAASALIWTTNTGFGCNTSITAAAVPASGLTGTTLAASVIASSLTSFGTSPTLTTAILNGTITGTSQATANTASTLVMRDASGNFSAGTITASLTGHASLDLALTGGTMSGAIAMGTNAVTGLTTLAGAGALTLQSNGSTLAGTITTGQKWGIGTDTNPQATLVVSNNASTGVAVPALTILAVNGTDATSAVLAFQSFGTGVNPTMWMRAARGTSASPSAVQSGDVLGFFAASGYAASAYDAASQSGFYVGASENHTLTANGTFLAFLTVPNTTTARAEAMRVLASGGVAIGTTTDPLIGGLQINGQTFAPNMASDTATADSTVCTATTGGKLLKGSGALGVCLGTSGAQFKTAFAPMMVGLDEVARLNLQNYRYRDGAGDSGARMQYGLTAQDVEGVIPDLVRHDASGVAINFDSGALLFIGLRAIQQLKVDNDNLRADVEALKKKAALR